MQGKKYLISLAALTIPTLSFSVCADQLNSTHEPKHFNKVMVVIFENMSYAEIKNEPTFKKLIEYSGHTLDTEGKLTKLNKNEAKQDISGNGYAFFSKYYNNHSGGNVPTRPSQPNYIAMTSGSIQGVFDNDNHDLRVDNLASELNAAGVTWKVYAEDLPDPKASTCFTDGFYPSSDGYQRKHEPFISYTDVQKNYNHCKNIVNSSHLIADLENMPSVSYYIPNQINDGHNGTLTERVEHANAFLSKMMGTNYKTGEPLPDVANAPFQKFMAQGGLLVITFDEPSLTGNPDRTMYTLLAGKMINSGAYPNKSGKNAPICYPPVSEQTKYPRDANGDYDRYQCNHYNLLKMIEANWNLRGLEPAHTSAGYKYAFALDNGIPGLWKN